MSFVKYFSLGFLALSIATPISQSEDIKRKCLLTALSVRHKKRALIQRIRAEWKMLPLNNLKNESNNTTVMFTWSWRPYPDRRERVYLIGKARTISLKKGYDVLEISDATGKTYLLDPEFAGIRAYYKFSNQPKFDLREASRNLNPDFPAYLDDNELFKLCRKYKKLSNSEDLAEIKKIAKTNLRPSILLNPRFREAKCVSVIGLAALNQLQNIDAREKKEKGWYRDHSSNFFYTLSYMASLDHCLQALTHKHRRKFFVTTLGAAAAGNIWEEVDLRPYIENKGLPVFNSAGNPVQTDVGDLYSGATGILAYSMITMIVESWISSKILKSCR